MARGPRQELAEKMAGEIALSDDPGETVRKWRTDFEVSQTGLADALSVSPSVVSDYESGRRDNPGIGVVRRVVSALLDIDEQRGGEHIRQHARVLSAGFTIWASTPPASHSIGSTTPSTRPNWSGAARTPSPATPSSTPSRRSHACLPTSSISSTASRPTGPWCLRT